MTTQKPWVVPTKPPEYVGCTIIGVGVPLPEVGSVGVVRIGSGDTFLELRPSGKATLHGVMDNQDAAVDAVLEGIRHALRQNPYYIVPDLG